MAPVRRERPKTLQPAHAPAANVSATRPRLQSVNHDFAHLDEQLRQVAHIISLPADWTSLCGGEPQSSALQHLARPRAEWVLRWVLDKLKDEAETGQNARQNPAAWQLLDLMLHVLPVSRSAPHLRDASFTTILERTLVENFGDNGRHTSNNAQTQDATQVNEASEPSRKRKRGASKPATSKPTGQPSSDPQALFAAVKRVLGSIIKVGVANTGPSDTVQAELMKMVLRTESAQAARILRFWLVAVHGFCHISHPPSAGMLDLSLVLEIWELRTVEASDEAASTEQFTAECLIPVLMLGGDLQNKKPESLEREVVRETENAIQTLEKLLVRHLLAPARAAFFADTAEVPADSPLGRDAAAFDICLHPLRAKYLQAAQIEDANEVVPAELSFLFGGATQLLDLAIRASPSNTPKARLADKPWIQAVFVSLLECLGCSLREKPTWASQNLASKAVERAVNILRSHNISIKPSVLEMLFWYHCGVKAHQTSVAKPNWALIAALIQLDPSTFTTENRSKLEDNSQGCLADIIFQHISQERLSSVNGDKETPWTGSDVKNEQSDIHSSNTTRNLVVEGIILPLISAFAQTRNLLGFISRWDLQMKTNLRIEAADAKRGLIWEDHKLKTALSDLFEQSLTHSQISDLIQIHTNRLKRLEDVLISKDGGSTKSRLREAASSTIIISLVLQAIQSDDNINAAQRLLLVLMDIFTTWVKDQRYVAHTRLSLSWTILCQLSSRLWPVKLHASSQLQQTLLRPLVEQAMCHISADSKGQNGREGYAVTNAAAMFFLLDTCNRLNTVSGSEELICAAVRKVIQSLFANHLESVEYDKMIELFCSCYSHLLCYLDAEEAREALATLLRRLSSLRTRSGCDISGSLPQIFGERGQISLQNAYVAVLLDALQPGDADPVQSIASNAITAMQPSAILREKRESILDHLTTILKAAPAHSHVVLSAMIKLMEVPNASAELATRGESYFEIASGLHEGGHESPRTLAHLQQLVRLTLEHIMPNRDQDQSKTFLQAFGKKIDSIVRGKKSCTASRLAILRATVLEQKDANILNVRSYIERLKICLTSNKQDGKGAPLETVLDAFTELPMFYLLQPDIFRDLQHWLQSWIKENADLDAYLAIKGPSPVELTEYVGRLHMLVAKFKLYPNERWFIDLTLKVAHEPLADTLRRNAFATVKETCATLESSQKLELVSVLANPADPNNRDASFGILSDLISTFPDKISTDDTLRHQQLALLSRLCTLLEEAPDDACFNAIIRGINTLLNEKASFVTQHGIESVLSALVKITSRTSPCLSPENASDTFARVCETTRLILLVHRSRLGGRLHLLVPLLQSLLFCLFIPSSNRSGALPFWLRSPANSTLPIRLSPQNAAQYTRVLSTLCNPPQSSISKSHQNNRKSRELNDPIKAAREKLSTLLYPLLASFCRFQLAGRLDPGVREKLMPGMWDVLGTASLKKEVLDAMFAGLGRSEKDVWRGVWSEWEGARGRKERFVAGEAMDDGA